MRLNAQNLSLEEPKVKMYRVPSGLSLQKMSLRVVTPACQELHYPCASCKCEMDRVLKRTTDVLSVLNNRTHVECSL